MRSIDKAYRYEWLAEDVSEEEIILLQRTLAGSGFFVEPASATSLYAIKKLRESGKIKDGASVLMMLTGCGLKDTSVLSYHPANVRELDLQDVEAYLSKEH
ncbi:MAG: pyridoxal-phosphate dependent enzyme [Candidatus Marinimicrobia bacterium]|nr:pyridoxal-phosphate dependent enzyme [Candidatus Neomarinimicrobiota bacterium]